MRPQDYGFTEADLDKTIDVLGPKSYQSLAEGFSSPPTRRQIIEKMKKIYCGKVCTKSRWRVGLGNVRTTSS